MLIVVTPKTTTKRRSTIQQATRPKTTTEQRSATQQAATNQRSILKSAAVCHLLISYPTMIFLWNIILAIFWLYIFIYIKAGFLLVYTTEIHTDNNSFNPLTLKLVHSSFQRVHQMVYCINLFISLPRKDFKWMGELGSHQNSSLQLQLFFWQTN